MGSSGSKVNKSKIKVLFSSYAGSPLFHYRVDVNGYSFINPPGLSVESGTDISITPIKDNSVEGGPTSIENITAPMDLSINVLRSNEAPGFKSVYTVNSATQRSIVLYYPNDNTHKDYNIHIIYANIKATNPSLIITKDPEIVIFATDARDGTSFGPELVLSLENVCSAYNIIADRQSFDVKIEAVGVGNKANTCDQYIYIEPL
jgi:hypothetical protein